MKKYSIIVTTYGLRCEDLLKPCLESIKKYTNLDTCEVLVIANGCYKDGKTDNTREFVESLGEPFKLVWYDEALGYARACNRGMEQAQGEYIVLLNNDTIILEQEKNTWLNMLEEPFKKDPFMAVTGPMKAWSPSAQDYFLIGFCTMFKKEVLDKIGLYDESFDAYGEDCDICLRAEKLGYHFSAVPDSGLDRVSEDAVIGRGGFPIFHRGNESYKNWVGGEALLEKNNKILSDKFNPNNINVDKAIKCDGYMNHYELRWLAEHVKALGKKQ